MNNDVNNSKRMSLEQLVLVNWLDDFEPYHRESVDDDVEPLYMTSADIASALSDMIELSYATIVETMLKRNYFIGQSPSHTPCWVMMNKQI